jgi:hypothetical protein
MPRQQPQNQNRCRQLAPWCSVSSPNARSPAFAWSPASPVQYSISRLPYSRLPYLRLSYPWSHPKQQGHHGQKIFSHREKNRNKMPRQQPAMPRQQPVNGKRYKTTAAIVSFCALVSGSSLPFSRPPWSYPKQNKAITKQKYCIIKKNTDFKYHRPAIVNQQ